MKIKFTVEIMAVVSKGVIENIVKDVTNKKYQGIGVLIFRLI